MQASAEKMYYPRYQFILLGWYDYYWWVGSAAKQKDLMDRYNCSVEDRQRVLQYSLAIFQDQFISNFSKVADSGIVSLLGALFVLSSLQIMYTYSLSRLI